MLKEAGAALKPAELALKHGIATATLQRWPSKYGGVEVNEAKRLGQVEEQNRQLKAKVAGQVLDIRMPKDILSKNGKPRCQANLSQVPRA